MGSRTDCLAWLPIVTILYQIVCVVCVKNREFVS